MNGNGGRPEITLCPPDPLLKNWPYVPDSDLPGRFITFIYLKRYYKPTMNWNNSYKMMVNQNCFWDRRKPAAL